MFAGVYGFIIFVFNLHQTATKSVDKDSIQAPWYSSHKIAEVPINFLRDYNKDRQ